MLARYTIYRGKRPEKDPLPEGLRQDTRKHTRHLLRPPTELVVEYLADPRPERWPDFARAYVAGLEERFKSDREQFDKLARLAEEEDVYLGCSCPTQRNPDVRHCHTYLALQFMKARYPGLEVQLPL